jgi:integrase
MTNSAIADGLPSLQIAQPDNVRDIAQEARDRLIVFISHVGGVPKVESLYGDSVWWPVGATTNTARSRTKLDFKAVPTAFEEVTKAMVYRYLRRGCAGSKRPGPASLVKFLSAANSFLRYISSLGIKSLTDVTPLVCSTYLQSGRRKHIKGTHDLASDGLPTQLISKEAQYKKLKVVERIYELSQFTLEPMPSYPWPRGSADKITGIAYQKGEITPLIPNDVFEKLFQAAWTIVEEANMLLDHRDAIDAIELRNVGRHTNYVAALKSQMLVHRGFKGTCRTLTMSLNELRIACYIVIASLSGCRNHELANLKTGSVYRTSDADGNAYWWMCSMSSKTGTGHTEWMIPEAAVAAIKALERWAEPYQRMLRAEVAALDGDAPKDKTVSHPAEHVDALFLGLDLRNKCRVRTLSLQAVNNALKKFAADAGIDWQLASHQFRRKFANYAARSQFGDLRYLKEHFKHWSMDMTLGYALNDSQEMALYLEIQDELDELKQGVVESWLDSNEPLAGGYGNGLVEWRSNTDNVVLFKSRAAMIRSIAASTPIRSNGHSWCTAKDNLCVGNDIERTRCADDCENSVIGRMHAPLYQSLYDQLQELEALPDIGATGRERVRRDLERCSKVLNMLSTTPIGAAES